MVISSHLNAFVGSVYEMKRYEIDNIISSKNEKNSSFNIPKPRNNQQAQKSQQSINNKQFKTKHITVKPYLGIHTDDIAHYWG